MSIDPSLPRQELLRAARYMAVTVVGLAVDLGVGFAAHRLLPIPLVTSAALGFLTGVAVNYLLFEFWVFRSGKLSWGRLGKAYVAAQAALIVRLVCVWLLGMVIVGLPQAALLTLTLAAGVSFGVNFLLIRVFLR